MAVRPFQKSKEIFFPAPGRAKYFDVGNGGRSVPRGGGAALWCPGVVLSGWVHDWVSLVDRVMGCCTCDGERPVCPPPSLSPLSSLSDMEADHQLPLFWAPGIQFLFQHDISVSFGLSEALCSLFGLDAIPPVPSSSLG